MIDKLSQSLQFHQQALSLRQQRQEVIANNIANADTPNFKARDINFSAELQRASASLQGTTQPTKTHAGHLQLGASNSVTAQLQYRTPTQSRLDGNTVDMDIERTQFLDNSLRYQADIQFLDDRTSGLRKAMQPEQ
ncbi:flagellar basal body rod protein FlgB [Pseudidiomarina aestuarii]|uniref:Flagellar basal body rod protein FlgB n=1 Tax=Pseudidiomarina aestuarii TaxID=624146 RepID=A0A7Z6ZVV4_9GAMM|nr:flagellar basal body rod protein FlgB [Pseudidiomarina aestuarii]RUO42166.1 flagellar basal body rod protein FlgB [Pseudidiomarina aestuarii]